MEEGETDNIVHSLQCLCTQQVECIGPSTLLFCKMSECRFYTYIVYTCILEFTCVYIRVHVYVHVAHCTLNMYCILIAPNMELGIHVDHLHTWQ